MDIIAYKDKTKAPVRPEDLALLQEMTAMVADAVAGSATANVIMRGCEVQGNTITAGILCVAGELIFANAGLKNTNGTTKYAIVETVSDAMSNDVLYKDWRKIRRAVIDNSAGTIILDYLPRYCLNGYNKLISSIGSNSGNVNYIVNVYRNSLNINIQGGLYLGVGTNKPADSILFTIPQKSFFKDIRSLRWFHAFDSMNTSNIGIHIDDDGNVRLINSLNMSVERLLNFNASILF